MDWRLMTIRYVLTDGPTHVLDDKEAPLPGHYEAVFSGGSGNAAVRYLTDKGYAELLRLVDAGQRSFTPDELEWLSTPPTFEDLLATMQAESGEGG
jgi:hypothetical protein